MTTSPSRPEAVVEELKALNTKIDKLLKIQTEQLYVLNGFTSGGSSFNGYVTDPMTTAYLSVLGPVLAVRLNNQDIDLTELMKGSIMLSNQVLEELNAYRSEQGGKDLVKKSLEFMEWMTDDKDKDSGQPEEA